LLNFGDMLKLGKKTNCLLLLCLFCATSNAQFYVDLSSGVAMRQKFSVFTQHDAKVVYASINADINLVNINLQLVWLTTILRFS